MADPNQDEAIDLFRQLKQRAKAAYPDPHERDEFWERVSRSLVGRDAHCEHSAPAQVVNDDLFINRRIACKCADQIERLERELRVKTQEADILREQRNAAEDRLRALDGGRGERGSGSEASP